MIYQNRQPEEGINYSSEHPLKEFLQLLAGIILVITAVVWCLNLMAGTLAGYIPFEFEKKMVAGFNFSQLGDLLPTESPSEPSTDLEKQQDSTVPEHPHAATQQRYLQELADRLAPGMNLPPGMTITVHYSDTNTVNAFATLGGNLVFFRGLIDKIKSEDELAAVMAHEIAHIKYRHPIVALGKGLTLATLGIFVSGASGSKAGEWLIGNSANLSLLKFSRDQERAADADAAAALIRAYGHLGGAEQLFKRFSELEGTGLDRAGVIELFRSHPYSEDRWQELQNLARVHDWQIEGRLTPISLSPGQ
ncbi:MAG: M48 family metallopeptidase [Gammaproteobacteria bacterium]|nr:M48 family metallopeptidase [Gammaproteobacteria bacterium]